jgi:hypothetical protein
MASQCAISKINIDEFSHIFEGLDKNIDIKTTRDNETNPAVYCPVADLFGYN